MSGSSWGDLSIKAARICSIWHRFIPKMKIQRWRVSKQNYAEFFQRSSPKRTCWFIPNLVSYYRPPGPSAWYCNPLNHNQIPLNWQIHIYIYIFLSWQKKERSGGGGVSPPRPVHFSSPRRLLVHLYFTSPPPPPLFQQLLIHFPFQIPMLSPFSSNSTTVLS